MPENSSIQGNRQFAAQAEDTLDLKEMWRIVRSYRIFIAAIFIFTVGLAAYLAITTQPTFEATTTVLIRESKSDPSAFVFDFGVSSSVQRLKNEIEVLKSYSLLSEIVRDLIDTGYAKQNTLFGTRYIRKRYRAFSWLLNWIIGDEKKVIHPDSLTYEQFVDIVEVLRENTTVIPVRDADVLKISVLSSDSTEALLLTNMIADRYRKEDLAGGRGEIQFILTFLDSQIVKYESRLMKLEEELEAFQSANQIFSVDGSAELLLKDLTEYESIYYKNLAELEVSKHRVDYLKGQLNESEQQLMEEIVNTNNPMIVSLRQKIADTEAQKIQQMVDEGWNESSMQAKDYDRRINEMKSRLTELTQNLILSGWSEEDPFSASQDIYNKIVEQEVEVYAAQSRADEYKKLVEKISVRLNVLPTQTLKYARLERERRLNENLYLTMKEKYEESRITEAGQLGKVRILDPALVAEKVRPNRKLYLLFGAIIGIGLGIAYASFREILDDTVKAVEQLERKGLTVIGIVPDIHQDSRNGGQGVASPSKGGKEFRRRLITYEDPKSPISEAYRTIRTNISYSRAEDPIKSIIVSSPQPGEGKSTTVANLAIAFAQLRWRTVLIDTDLRKPVQHNVFNVDRSPGISEYLINSEQKISNLVRETKIPNLYLITAGLMPPNPSELLGSQRMSTLVDQLEKDWDMVLFDSPPLVAVTDASMISSEIDALIMVVKAGQTERAAVDRALDTISHVQAPLAGIVLNGVKPESLGGKYSYYYSYYQYYYSDDGKRKKKR